MRTRLKVIVRLLALSAALGALPFLWGSWDGAQAQAQAQAPLTGDEILAKAAERSAFVREGSRISIIEFEIVFPDGTTQTRTFAFFGKRDEAGERLLIYFLEPELECGTIFLSFDPAEPGAKTRLWLYLSGLGQVKELVSEEDRNASFAGSNLQNDQVGGGFDLHEDYTGELLGEEAVTVSWLGEETARPAYKVGLTRRPEADVDFPTGTVWIDKEEFLTLRGEFDNEAGQLEQTIALDDFVEFEGEIVPNRIVVENVLDGSKTTVVTLERRVVEPELPDEVFDPDNLASFNPEAFGVDSPCVP